MCQCLVSVNDVDKAESDIRRCLSMKTKLARQITMYVIGQPMHTKLTRQNTTILGVSPLQTKLARQNRIYVGVSPA